MIFEGVCTALVTPFVNNKIDYVSLKNMLERQVSLGASAVLVTATTGEAPTLTDKEHLKVVEYAVNIVNGKIPVLAGAGSNYTNHAIKMSKQCESLGVNGLLHVTPYYNKTSENGLIDHFLTIADKVNIPIILYNVPSRTGVSINIDQYQKLSKHPNIVGIKESCDSLSKLNSLITVLGDSLDIYSGNDDNMILSFMSGLKGVISVVANLIPDKINLIYNLTKSGNYNLAIQTYKRYYNLIKLLSKEVNPIPIKYALSRLKLCDNRLRRPLLPIYRFDELDLELEKLSREISLWK